MLIHPTNGHVSVIGHWEIEIAAYDARYSRLYCSGVSESLDCWSLFKTLKEID